ncbi:MAG TPA: phosphoribosylformylglycinamidine synthase subunit PurL [Clostridia bacterium]|nr:phosphoribosylformylglycinamidine synthase subunit PurL [Clostridia bacterium]
MNTSRDRDVRNGRAQKRGQVQDRVRDQGQGRGRGQEQGQSRPSWWELGLTEAEYREIVEILGREPNWTELGMFSVMWSEHCSYKHSRPYLKLFPTQGSRILIGPGENAGVIRLDERWAVVMKCESHNHPVAVEPYQGAATGVGGIVRDILAMGARPVAILDSLRFGPPDDPRSRFLFQGVVSGIAGYGNCIGVPTVGGEVYFDEAYASNPLCNVMCVGLVEIDRIARARASEVGSPVFLVGASTGRDGIHGATFASQELGEDSEASRPNVQVGDPFMEKLAIETCLELVERGYVIGIQDMGAAGITSSCAETAARAGTGIEIDLDKVPLRESGMTPYEIMLSESQERMLVIGKSGRENEIAEVCRRWGIGCALIGRVTDDGMLTVKRGEIIEARVPAKALAEQVPVVLSRESRPSYIDEEWSRDPVSLLGAKPGPSLLAELASAGKTRSGKARCEPEGEPGEPEKEPEEEKDLPRFSRDLLKCLSSPTIADKAWVYSQYDHMVQNNTAVLPGAGDAAVLRVKGTGKAIALTMDGNGRYAYLDPEMGGAIAVAEAARNVVSTGAEPVAITNCLNFPNPEKGETMWQFSRVVRGMALACEILGTPVTGGNVSFYNETLGKPVYPTPVVGMLGIIHDVKQRLSSGFVREGDIVALIGPLDGRGASLGGSEYLKVKTGLVTGKPPQIDLDVEKRVQRTCLRAAQSGLLHSAHDCSEGGLAVTLAECCMLGRPGSRGAEISLRSPKSAPERPVKEEDADEPWFVESLLFGEAQSRIVVTLHPDDMPALSEIGRTEGAPVTAIGRVTADGLWVNIDGFTVIMVSTAKMEEAWRGRFDDKAMSRKPGQGPYSD